MVVRDGVQAVCRDMVVVRMVWRTQMVVQDVRGAVTWLT